MKVTAKRRHRHSMTRMNLTLLWRRAASARLHRWSASCVLATRTCFRREAESTITILHARIAVLRKRRKSLASATTSESATARPSAASGVEYSFGL
jgi:hypothetical protein